LQIGEREAIRLAQEQRADLLLIDERRGRLEAKRRGLATTGTLGVLWLPTNNLLRKPIFVALLKFRAISSIESKN